MDSRKKIEDWERGIIWDFVIAQTGMGEYDLLQAYDIIHQNIHKYKGDYQYLLFRGCSRKIINEIKKAPEEYLNEAENIVKKIGIEKTTCDFDTYYGLIRYYARHKKFYNKDKINKLKKLCPNKKQQLTSIIRRLAYIDTMGDEINYLIDRYDHKIKPIYTEFLLNRFENFTAFAAQTALQIVDLYYDMNPCLQNLKRSQCNFKNIFNLLKNEIDFFDSANDSFYSLILSELRNNIVHGCGIELEQINEDFFLKYEIDLAKQNKLKIYKLNIRIEKVIAPLYKGFKEPGTWYLINDPNFNFVVWKLQVTTNNSFNLSNPKLIVEIDMKEYVRIMVKTFLYHISDKIFRKLVKIENYWEGNEYFGKWINRFFVFV